MRGLLRAALPVFVCAALLALATPGCRAGIQHGLDGRGHGGFHGGSQGGFHGAPQERPRGGFDGGFHNNFVNPRGPRPQHEMNHPEPMRPQYNPREIQHEDGLGRPESRTEYRRLYGHGQEHLPTWWAAHRNLSPDQQAEAMRRQPGFRKLPQRQQQMLLNRLHNFDQRPPAQQERMLGRMEMFERLSPERQQEVRGAAQAFRSMAPAEKQRMRTAFHQLRMMPPAERRQMLNSSYGQGFSPQERTVLGNMLSIEPYRPPQQQQPIPQPYFGRRQ